MTERDAGASAVVPSRRLSSRLRFTLLSTAIVALSLSAIFTVVVLYQTQFVRGRLDARLRGGIEDVASTVTPEMLAIAEQRGVVAAIEFDELRHMDLSLALFSGDGRLLASDIAVVAKDLESEIAPHIAALGDDTEFIDAAIEFGRMGTIPHFRVAMRRLDVGGAVLAVFASTDVIERSAGTTAAAFLVSLPIALLVIGLATWYVAGLVMRPIAQVRAIAQSLAPDSIPEDVELTGGAPEIEGLQAELEAAMARIDAGYETQSRFMANVAHELKTPIGVILAQGQTLSNSALENEETRGFIDSTIEEMRRLGRMIESFLMLTHVREGKAVHSHDRIAVNDLVMDSFEHCLPMAREYGVVLAPTLVETSLDTDDDPVIYGDGDLLRTAIDNLVRNAIRFSQSGDRIEITASDADDAWTIDVRDFGPGIPDELIDRIFDRFAQASSEERRGRGSGLGLEIAQGIAELHGGTITVRNEPRGCRFVIRLPKSGPYDMSAHE